MSTGAEGSWSRKASTQKSAGLNRPAPAIPDHGLIHPIGRGAYGEVWLARNVLGTLRAIKIVHCHDFHDREPFEREFHGIEKFEPVSRSHEGLIDILQIGRNDVEEYFYYVMELADAAEPLNAAGSRSSKNSGMPTPAKEAASTRCSDVSDASYAPRTLRSDLKRHGRLAIEDCLKLGLALTGALEHLHRAGLVHRDVKPSNIIFVKNQPKLADIGLVAGVEEAGAWVGTEGYIPPEGPGKPQADIYSLGKVLYEAAMGRSRMDFPSLATDWDSLPEQQRSRLAELNEVLVKACESEPGRRYATAEEMRRDLQALTLGDSVRSKNKRERNSKWGKRAFRAAMVGTGIAVIGFIVTGGCGA